MQGYSYVLIDKEQISSKLQVKYWIPEEIWHLTKKKSHPVQSHKKEIQNIPVISEHNSLFHGEVHRLSATKVLPLNFQESHGKKLAMKIEEPDIGFDDLVFDE